MRVEMAVWLFDDTTWDLATVTANQATNSTSNAPSAT